MKYLKTIVAGISIIVMGLCAGNVIASNTEAIIILNETGDPITYRDSDGAEKVIEVCEWGVISSEDSEIYSEMLGLEMRFSAGAITPEKYIEDLGVVVEEGYWVDQNLRSNLPKHFLCLALYEGKDCNAEEFTLEEIYAALGERRSYKGCDLSRRLDVETDNFMVYLLNPFQYAKLQDRLKNLFAGLEDL